MNPDEHEMFRAAIHGDREAFEMIIRTQSRALFAIAYGIAAKSRRRRRRRAGVARESVEIALEGARSAEVSGLAVDHRRGIARATSRGSANRNRCRRICRREPIESTTYDDSLGENLRAALTELPELHRSALTLRYFEELDYAAIEQLLGLSNGALRGILGRALQTLRKRLRPALTSLG